MVEGKNQNHLSGENVRRLVAAFHGYTDEERYSRVVEMKEIQENAINLSISRYARTAEEEEQLDMAAELKKWVGLWAQRNEAEARMMGFLWELGNA